jgi:hypothetical protein
MELHRIPRCSNPIPPVAIHLHCRNSDLFHSCNAWQNLDKRFPLFSLLTVISNGKKEAMDPKGNQTQGSAPRLHEAQVWK